MPFLEVRNLTLGLIDQPKTLVEEISFSLERGEILGVLGESGCGKSLTGLALIRLFPPGVTHYSGDIFLDGTSLYDLDEREMYKIRGRKISIIFQDPLSSLNPVLKIKEQIEEVLKVHLPHLSKKERTERILRLLEEVEIRDPELRLNCYPHQLSGGLRQRVMIATALAGDPEILIADEPTTALDPTLQVQILKLFRDLNLRRKLTIIFITHDLGIVRWLANRVAVFYAGEIVEMGHTEKVFNKPLHPYTQALINSYPKEGKILIKLKGQPVDLLNKPRGCRFLNRCDQPCKEGEELHPQLIELNSDHLVRCFRYF